jgi:hypothetical protein
MDYSILKLDIDIEAILFNEWKIEFINSRKFILNQLGHDLTDFKITGSKSGNIHVRLHIKPPAKSDTGLNMLQFLCGDSHLRVNLNQKRIYQNMPHWNKLFIDKVKLNEIQL